MVPLTYREMLGWQGEEVGTPSFRFVILGKPFNLQASISFIQLTLRTHRCLKHSTSCIDNDVVREPEASEVEMLQWWGLRYGACRAKRAQ